MAQHEPRPGPAGSMSWLDAEACRRELAELRAINAPADLIEAAQAQARLAESRQRACIYTHSGVE